MWRALAISIPPAIKLETYVCAEDLRCAAVVSDAGKVTCGNCQRDARRPVAGLCSISHLLSPSGRRSSMKQTAQSSSFAFFFATFFGNSEQYVLTDFEVLDLADALRFLAPADVASSSLST